MESHLLQMRGLKLINPEARKKALVASFTDAWIETHSLRYLACGEYVASFTDAWIETRI